MTLDEESILVNQFVPSLTNVIYLRINKILKKITQINENWAMIFVMTNLTKTSTGDLICNYLGSKITAI